MGGGLGGGGSAAALQLFKFLDGITVSSSLNVESSRSSSQDLKPRSSAGECLLRKQA